MSTMHEDTTGEPTLLDWRGLDGADAIVNTAKAVKRLDGRPGVLRILADDQAFPADLESWCRVTRSQLLQLEQEPSGTFVALVRVNGRRDATHPFERSDASGQRDEASGELDCRGMLCPEPILELARVARGLPPDGTLEVLADDPAFPMDLQSWCRSTGMSLAALEEREGVYRAVVRARQHGEPGDADPVSEEHTFETATGLGGMFDLAQPALAAPPLARAGGPGPAWPALAASGGKRVDLGGVSPGELPAVLEWLSKVSVEGGLVTVTGLHGDFARDVMAWCARDGHALEHLETSSSPMMAMVRLRQAAASADPAQTTALAPARGTAAASAQGCTILLMHNDLEGVMAALMTAATSAASGMPATILFAFWGINVLRADRPRPGVPGEKVSLAQRMLKWIMPRGARRQRLRKLNFAGAGGLMMRALMKRKNLPVVEELMEQACARNVRFMACTMSMSLMGVTRGELLDLPNVELGGMAAFMDHARRGGITLVF